MASGLLNSDISKNIRENALKRNLFTVNSPYEIDNPKLINTINTIANIINPGNAFDITNTIIGRSLQLGPQTPLVQIGNRQLLSAFTKQIARLAVTNVLPTVSITNLFDGDPTTKLITLKEDYDITVDQSQTKLQRFINEITGIQSNSTPFNKDSTNIDYVNNTGKGQLNLMISLLNRNYYRPSNPNFIQALNNKGLKLGSINGPIVAKKFIDEKNLGDFPEALTVNTTLSFNEAALRQRNQDRIDGNEYGVSKESIADFGKTNVFIKTEDLLSPLKYGHSDVTGDTITWGSDDLLSSLDNKFSARKGLLTKTDALIKALGNKKFASFDQTQKRLVDKDGTPHFNGTPFRQHTKIDQYDRFEKAIRFVGNQMYNGNSNSVVNKTVIPKFHPIREGQNFNNRNLMFSIENLAYVINSDGDTGIPLETSSDINNNVTRVTKTLKVPKTEIGDNGGRLMWFMPYDLKIAENAIAKHETTQFIGRGEPIYTYSNSERTATLSFIVLIDYPPQVYGRDHNEIARFYAMGGTGTTTFNKVSDDDISNKKKRIQDLKNQKDQIKPKQEAVTPDLSFTRKEISFYYPNDYPRPGDSLSSSITSIIALGYEDGSPSPIDSNVKGDTGLNKNFVDSIDSLINNDLTDDKLKYYKITITGSATKLHTTDYNLELSKRRTGAMKSYIQQRYRAIKGKDLNINIIEQAIGDSQSSQQGDQASAMYLPNIKTERYAKIVVEYNGATNNATQTISAEQQAQIDQINEDIESLNTEINVAEKQLLKNDFVLRNINDKYPRGFEDVDTIYSQKRVAPVFHSTTPEEFHRRLTFLQQCTRQGSSLIKRTVTNEGILTSKNSAFGRPPVCVLRIGDFWHTKVIIDNVSYDYEAPWDQNPEGMGMQPMIARIDIGLKIIGGQSLDIPIDAIQNAESFNYYANSTFSNTDVYQLAKMMEEAQRKYSDSALQETRKTKFQNNSK